LSRIAASVYGDANRWPDIYNANQGVIGSDPNSISPGQVLTIP
jgi:nucleoid-associated protein YgaU